MPPQQRPPPSNARAVDAEASVGLRTLALQFEATGKWAQAIKCYDACLAIAADEPRVEASVRLACARLLLRHTANAADARQQLERARLLLNTVRDGGGTGGGTAAATPARGAATGSFSVTSLRCAVFSELASVHASLGSSRAAADALARGSAAAAAAASAAASAAAAAAGSSSSSSSAAASASAAAWQAHFATRSAAMASPLHGAIFASGGGGSDPLEASSSWLPRAPPLAAAAVALARGAAAANEPGRAEGEAVEFVLKSLRLLEEVELEAKREREEEERARTGDEGAEDDIGGGNGGNGGGGGEPKRRKSSAGDAVPVVAAAAPPNRAPSFPASVYPSRAAELAHAARLRAHAEALRVALSLSAGDPVGDLGIADKGRCLRLADSLSAAVGASLAARGVREAEEGEVAAAVAAVAAGGGAAAAGGGGGGGGATAGATATAGAGARRRRGDGNGPAPPLPPLPSPASLAEDAEAAATAAGALATAAGVLRPLCKFVYASVHLARGLEVCDEGLARLGAAAEDENQGLEASLAPHVAAAAAPLVRARLVLLDSRARCWLSQAELAAARADVAAALALAGRWPRAAGPLIAPLLLPLAGIYCLCSRELAAARIFLGVAAAASGPRAYQQQALRRKQQLQQQQQQQQQQQKAGTPGAAPDTSPASAASFSSSSSIVQPPAGPAAPAASAALAAAHAAFAELADPSPAGGGHAARATSVLKAGLCFPAAPTAGPGVPRTHRATAQLALGCTLVASAAASSAVAAAADPAASASAAAASAAAAAARARARTCFGSAMAAAQRNLSNLQLTSFALGAMAPLLAYDDGKPGGDGEAAGAGAGAGGGGGGGGEAAAAGVEAGRTLFIGAMDVAKQIDCPAAVLAATCGWVQQGIAGGGGGGGGGEDEARASSEAYIARYEARRAARVAEARGLASVPEVQDTEEALAGASAEHEAIVTWMPVCQ